MKAFWSQAKFVPCTAALCEPTRQRSQREISVVLRHVAQLLRVLAKGTSETRAHQVRTAVRMFTRWRLPAEDVAEGPAAPAQMAYQTHQHTLRSAQRRIAVA
jgi:hypothetical protein